LPPAGSLGVNLKNQGEECRIVSLVPGGGGEKAGLRKGDVVVAIDGQPVKTIADVHLELWDKTPGERVHVEVRRKRFLGVATRALDVELTGGSARTQ
jgi:S1-C subfamily serine protease